MLKKGESKNLGVFSIIIPDSKSYKTREGNLHILVGNSGMTHKEASENLVNYPGCRLPNMNECIYLHNFSQLGISILKERFYWTSESLQGGHKVVYKNGENYPRMFTSLSGENKLPVFYIKDNI